MNQTSAYSIKLKYSRRVRRLFESKRGTFQLVDVSVKGMIYNYGNEKAERILQRMLKLGIVKVSQ